MLHPIPLLAHGSGIDDITAIAVGLLVTWWWLRKHRTK
jgi:hypothetical protein